MPKRIRLGEKVVYSTHPKACEVRVPVAMQQGMAILEEARTEEPWLLKTERVERSPGIFTAFIPQWIEQLC
ncbi:hypothetical protein ES703_98648 [subsurface metagenome]